MSHPDYCRGDSCSLIQMGFKCYYWLRISSEILVKIVHNFFTNENHS